MNNDYYWTKAEEKYLLSLVHDNPYNLSECYRKFRIKYPNRALYAVKNKYYRLIDLKDKKVFMLFSKKHYSKQRKVITNRTPKHYKEKLKENFFESIWTLITGK